MNGTGVDPAARARELRDAFDRGFARPLAAPVAGGKSETFLLIMAGGRQYAIRTCELRGIHRGRRITPLPSTAPVLLGIVGIRSQLIATYGLAALLGSANDAAGSDWLVTSELNGFVVALAFDGFLGSVRVGAADVHGPETEGAERARHVAGVVRTSSGAHCVLNIRSIFEALSGATGSGRRVDDKRGNTDDRPDMEMT